MSVKDPKPRDMKILHVQFLEPARAEEQERLSKILYEMFKAKDLDKEYLLLVTGPEFKLSVSKMEEFIKELTNEANMLRSADRIDMIIKKLQDARHEHRNKK